MTQGTSHCKYCGRGSMRWVQVNGKWRMLDRNDVVHVCANMRLEKIREAKQKKEYE